MGFTLLLIVAFVAESLAGPIQTIHERDQCTKQCTVSNKFSYEPETSYEFNYEADLRTAIQGASEDHAGIHMSAKVHLDYISKCEMIMKLSDVQMTDHDPETSTMKPVTSDLLVDLESKPVRVSYQDGVIEHICLSEPEFDKTLNIKRGILSLIQNNMDDINKAQTVTETDISGECDTKYTSEDKGWYNKLIKKSKNLLGCKGRQQINTAIHGIPYGAKSDIQSLPLIKSTHECEQELSKQTGRLQSATCHEKHVFAPFSRQDSGATTHSTQTLKFVKELKARFSQAPITMTVSMQFQHSSGTNTNNMTKDVESKLMDICVSTMNGVAPETPSLFKSLATSMKSMTALGLSAMYQKIKSKDICPDNNARVSKFFLDALPMTGTSESIKLMTQLITTNEVSGREAEMWMASLYFIQNPTMDMLAEVKPLLSMVNYQEIAMLSVSSLVHSLCKNNPACERTLEVKKIINQLEGMIAPSCKVTEETFKTSLLALRAIGNAGYGTGAIPTLEKCIQRSENPIEIRLSAIEAYRRIPCSADKSRLVTVFASIEEDSEIRISAYKSLMECPSVELILKVKEVLNKEQVNQVGSYVWSHLTNLMETSDPHKQAIRSILEDETLKVEFDMDKRKYSRNYEGSLFIEKLNTGATAEGDIIWSSKSFIPRSAMVNLTVDLFGSAVNLFEIGGRVEGLEYFIESYFGPNGYFSEKDVQTAVDETALESIKFDKIKRIDKRMNAVMDELRGSLYLRVFGNEMQYMTFKGLNNIPFGSNSFNFLDILTKLTNEDEYQFTHSAMFMDSSITVPTCAGFSLTLTVNGTATVDLKASGKMDVTKMTSLPPSMDIHGVIRPSAAVVVTSSMSIDAIASQVGVKMVSTLHSSTSVQGKVSLAEGTILNVEFELPEEKMEILRFSSSFYTVHQNAEREQKMITENRQEHSICSGAKFSYISGYELCGDLNFPNASLVENAPYFPLTGPVSAGLTLYKRDTQMKGYKLEARSTHTKDENLIRLAFSTPNSKTDRAFGVDINLNKAQGTFDASITSPWKKGDFRGSFVNDKTTFGASGRLNWDGKLRYEVTANVQSQKTGQETVYTPSLLIRLPGQDSIDVTGSIKMDQSNYFETDMSINGISSHPVTIKASLNKDKVMGATASLRLGPKREYSFESTMQTTNTKTKTMYKPQISVRSPAAEIFALGITYTNVINKQKSIDIAIDKIVTKPIMFSTSISTKDSRRGNVENVLEMDLTSEVAEIRMSTKLENKNMKTIAMNMDFTYVIPKIARDKIKLVSKFNNLGTKSLTKWKASIDFDSHKYPAYNFRLISNVNHNEKLLEIESDMAYGANPNDVNKKITLHASIDKAIKAWNQLNMAFRSKIEYGTALRLSSEISHTHEPMSLESKVIFRVNEDVYNSTMSLIDNSDGLIDVFGKLDISVPGKVINFSQLVKERYPNEFLSVTNATIGKSENSIISSWKKSSPFSFTISSNVRIDAIEPLQLDGEYILSPDVYKIGGSLQKGSTKYSSEMLMNVISGKSIQLSANIVYPDRHIITNIEGTKNGSIYNAMAEMRWDADRNEDSRISVNGRGQISGLNNINASITVQYPRRTIAFNVRHSLSNKMTSHIDFQWEQGKLVVIDAALGDYSKQEGREIIGSLKVATPFTDFKSMEATLNHQINNAMYKSQIDISWNPNKMISTTATLKKPFSIYNVDAEVIAKATALGFKTIQASLVHKMNKGLSTVGKLIWNKQSAQIDIVFSNKGDDIYSDIKGQVDIKTTFTDLREASASFSHKDNGIQITTESKVQYNKQQYSLQSILSNKFKVGHITVAIPDNVLRAQWTHDITNNEIVSNTNITWGKNQRIYIRFNGMQEINMRNVKLTSSMEISLKPEQTLIVDGSFDRTPSNDIDAKISVTLPSKQTVTLSAKKKNQNTGIMSSASLEYRTGKIIRLESFHRLDDIKQIKLKFTSPFTNDLTAEGMLDNSINNLMARVSIDAEPFLSKWSALATFDNTNGINCNLKINTPNAQYAYSQITITSTVIEGKRQSTIDVEYLPGKFVKLSNIYFCNNFKDIHMNVELTTTFTQMPYASVSFTHKGDLREFSSSVEMEYPRNTKTSGVITFSANDGLRGSVTIKTPFSADLSGSFRHKGILNSFESHGEIQWGQRYEVDLMHQGSMSRFTSTGIVSCGGDIYEGKLTFSLEPKLSTELSIKSPIQRFENIQLSHSFEGNLRTFSDHTELSSSGYGTYISDVRLDTETGLAADITIQTPIAEYSYVKAAVSHVGTLDKFVSHAEVKRGLSSYAADLKVSTDPDLNIDMSVETPFNEFKTSRFSLSHVGVANDFKLQIEAQINKDTIEMDLIGSIKEKWDIDLVIRSPYMNTIKASFDHTGSKKKFQSDFTFKYGKQNIQSNFKFQLDPSLNAVISLKSPFELFKHHELTITHVGGLDSFKCNLQYKCNGKAYIGDASFQTLNTIRAELNVKLAAFPAINIVVSHDGQPSNFKCLASMSYGKNNIQVDTSFSSVNGIKGSIALKTPFDNMQSISASLSHSGLSNNFRSQGEVTFNERIGRVDVIVDLTKDISATVSIKTPFKGFEDISSTFKHTGSIYNFNSLVVYTLNGKRSEGQVSFKNDRTVSGSASLKSDIPYVGNYEAMLTCQGNTAKFNIHGSINMNKIVSEANFDFDSTNGYVGSFSVDSPYLKKIDMAFKHLSTISSMNSNAHITYNGAKLYELLLDFSTKSSVSGIVRLTTSHTGYEITELSFNHNGNSHTVQSDAKLQIFNENYEANLMFASSPNIEASITIKSPYTETVDLRFDHSSTYPNWNTVWDISYGGQSMFNFDANLNFDLKVAGTIKLSTPLPGFSLLSTSFSHEGNWNNFKCHGEVTKETQSIVADLEYSPTQGSLTVSTPFTKDIKGSFKMDGSMLNSKSVITLNYGPTKLVQLSADMNYPQFAELTLVTALQGYETSRVAISRLTDSDMGGKTELVFRGQKHQADIRLNLDREISGSFVIATPLLPQLSSTFNIEMQPKNFRSHIELILDNKKHEVKTRFSTQKSIEGRFTAISPLISDFTVAFSTNTDTASLQSSAEASYGSYKLFDISSVLTIADKMSFELTAITPNIRTHLEMSLLGNLQDFTAHIKTTVNGNTLEGDASVRVDPNIAGSLRIVTPFTHPINARVSFDGQATNFKGYAEIGLMNKLSSCEVSLNTEERMEAKFSLQSPYIIPVSAAVEHSGSINKFKCHAEITLDSETHSVDASFDHQGSLRNFKTSASVAFDNERTEANLMFDIETSMRGSATLTLPQNNKLTMSFEHSGLIEGFKNTFMLKSNEQAILNFDITYSNNPLQGSILLKTPIHGYETLSVKYTHEGSDLNFKSHAELKISDQTTQCDISFNIGSKLEGKMSANSPYFPSANIAFDFSGTFNKFESNAELGYNGDTYSIATTVDTKSDIDLSVTIKTPINGYRTLTGKLTHSGLYPNVNSFVQVKSGRRNLLTGSAKIGTNNGLNIQVNGESVFTPTIQMKLDHSGTVSNFNCNGEIRYNGQSHSASIAFKVLPNLSGSFKVSSPFYSPLSANFEVSATDVERILKADCILNGGKYSLNLSLVYNNDIGATLSINTPIEHFTNIAGSIKYTRSYQGLKGIATFELSPTNKYEIEARSSWTQGINHYISIKSPISSLESTSASFVFEGIFPNVKSDLTLMLLNRRYSLHGELQDFSSGQITASLPFKGYEDLSLTYNRQGGINNMQTNMKIVYMTGKEITASFQNTITDKQMQTKAMLSTPYTEDILFTLSHNGQRYDFTNIVAFSMGDNNEISMTTTFNQVRGRLNFDSSLKTTFAGYSDEQNVAMKYEGYLPNFKASANAKILGSIVSLQSSLQTETKIYGNFLLKTPITDLSFTMEHSGNSINFNTKADIQYDNEHIKGSVQYSNFGWRRFETSVEVQTPFTGFELSKASFRHSGSANTIQCDSYMSIYKKDFTANLRASMEPLSAAVAITTPITGFEQIGTNLKINRASGIFNGGASINYMNGKTVSLATKLDMNSSPKVMNLKLTTPYTGYESAEINISHDGNLYNFQSIATATSSFASPIRMQAGLRYASLFSMDGSFALTSQISKIENIRFVINNTFVNEKYTSRIETSWASAKTITFDGSFIGDKSSVNTAVTITTPFDTIRQINIKSLAEMRNSRYSVKLSAQYNSKSAFDMDLSSVIGQRNSLSMAIRSPIELAVVIDGAFIEKYEGALTVSYSKNKGYRLTGSFDPNTKSLIAKYNSPDTTISCDGIFHKMNTKLNVDIDGMRYGYDMVMTSTDLMTKIILPIRSVKIVASQRSGTTEAFFFWDADKDETRKIGFRSTLVPSKESVKADVTLMMPSFGKDVQIDSEMIINRGRILFDGKAEFSYSQDKMKRFTVISRLEDISNSWSYKNYSFTIGISHPYTSVDVQLSSHVGNAEGRLTGGIDVKYLTTRKDTKSFSVNGEINKLLNTFSFDMNTPMKSIGINVNAQTKSPYSVSFTNRYDNYRPLNTIASFDPSKRSFDFQINYDLENPSSEFHVSAKYVNSSAIAAEVFHVFNRQRITDCLMTLRLNSSNLLHSRINWRPTMINDIKALYERKSITYDRKIQSFVDIAIESLRSEMKQKIQMIKQAFDEEIAPFTAVAEQEMDNFRDLYERNEYHIKDITDAVEEAATDVKLKCQKISSAVKLHMDTITDDLQKQMSAYIQSYLDDMQALLQEAQKRLNLISQKSQDVYQTSTGYVYNISAPVVQALNNNYDEYVQHMKQVDMSSFKNLADKYTASIYSIHDFMNTRINTIMNHNDIKYVKAISDKVYQQGQNAYKYWEIKENMEQVVTAIMEWLKNEVEREISDIKATILNIEKSAITVYDPEHGELQMEIHLPIPLKSLDAIPIFDIAPYVTRARRYIPRVHMLTLPSADIRTWLPPYEATATIDGEKVTTFDGVTIDLIGNCTYLLTRDFVDGNFSVALQKDGKNKTVTILADGKIIEIFSDGQVKVNRKPTQTPTIMKDITITSLHNKVFVDVAGHMQVDYDKDADLYTIRINGFYFRKVSGVLGNYDNEQSNDMTTSFGKNADSSDRLIKTWDIGSGRCR